MRYRYLQWGSKYILAILPLKEIILDVMSRIVATMYLHIVRSLRARVAKGSCRKTIGANVVSVHVCGGKSNCNKTEGRKKPER